MLCVIRFSTCYGSYVMAMKKGEPMPGKVYNAAPCDEPYFLQSHFLPAERKALNQISDDVTQVVANPLVDGLMTIANGVFAVLNEQRQVLAVNTAFLELVGITNVEEVLGLRVGECLQCIHAAEMPGGCGTSRYCSSCGAAISMMAALQTQKPQEQMCAITAEKDSKQVDIYFSVRSCPINIDGRFYLLFFLQDRTLQQNKSCLDSTFFHDINNILCGLVGKSQLLSLQIEPVDAKVKELHHIVLRVAQEIAIQDSLRKSLDSTYKPLYSIDSVNTILGEIEKLFSDHPLTAARKVEVHRHPVDLLLRTDFSLVDRIVTNMVTNALEATPDGGKVTVSVVALDNAVSFRVWNAGEIPENVAMRIFQRNFSTKSNMGRGFGTYSMKLFGEQVLGGTVTFESSRESGTTFALTLATK